MIHRFKRRTAAKMETSCKIDSEEFHHEMSDAWLFLGFLSTEAKLFSDPSNSALLGTGGGFDCGQRGGQNGKNNGKMNDVASMDG